MGMANWNNLLYKITIQLINLTSDINIIYYNQPQGEFQKIEVTDTLKGVFS